MKILSAAEDFERVSLSRFQRILEKLFYVSGLRKSQGAYEHWGLAKVYGKDAAIEAIAAAHGQAFAEYLSTPLQKLSDEVAASAASEGLAQEEYLSKLESKREQMLPEVKSCGSERHADAVLLALKKLARAAHSSDRQNA